MAKIADVGRLSFHEENISRRCEKIFSIALFHQAERRQAIEHDPCCAGIGSCLLRDFPGSLIAFVNPRKKVIFDRSVEDLTIGEIAENPHQRARREILSLVCFGHT